MTNHLAEARKLLRWAADEDCRGVTNEAGTLFASAATAHALVAIADAIRAVQAPAGACPSVYEYGPQESLVPDYHLPCRYLAGHTGLHRSDDGDVRWANTNPHAHTIGEDR